MAAPKDPSKYSFGLHSLVAHFAQEETREREVRVGFTSGAAAAQFRFLFYSFKKALKLAGHLEDLQTLDGVIAKTPTPRTPDEPFYVVFSLRDNEDMNKVLEAAIAQAQLGLARARTSDEHSHERSHEQLIEAYLGLEQGQGDKT